MTSEFKSLEAKYSTIPNYSYHDAVFLLPTDPALEARHAVIFDHQTYHGDEIYSQVSSTNPIGKLYSHMFHRGFRTGTFTLDFAKYCNTNHYKYEIRRGSHWMVCSVHLDS